MRNALGGEHRPEEDALICPTREDAAVVYRYLNRHGGFAGDADLLWQRLMGSGIGYGRLLVVLDAMEEQGLITREAGGFRVLAGEPKGGSDERGGPSAACAGRYENEVTGLYGEDLYHFRSDAGH